MKENVGLVSVNVVEGSRGEVSKRVGGKVEKVGEVGGRPSRPPLSAGKSGKNHTRVDNESITSIRNIVLNAITSRTELLKTLLDPRRDIDMECGHVDDPSLAQLNSMYKKEGIAQRVVGILPEECWQVDPEVYEKDEPDNTDFEKKWKELNEELDLLSTLAHADTLSGIGRFGIVLFGLNDGKPLLEPAIPSKSLKLLYTRAFDESVVQIASTEGDVSNPRYGLPTMYSIQFETTTTGEVSMESSLVHWTRVVHLADNRRLSEVLGESRMRPVFNRLQDLRKLLGGSAEMYWQGAFPGLSFEMDPQVLALGGMAEVDTTALKDELQNYMNGLQRYLTTTGLSAKSLAPQVVDPTPQIEAQIKAICIAIGVPYRVFAGTEEGKLAGEQDSSAWANRLKRRQNKYLTPKVIRPFLNRLIELGILPKPSTIKVWWPDMQTPSNLEKAQVIAVQTTALKDYVQGDISQIIPLKTYFVEFLHMSPEEAEIILEQIEKELFENGDQMVDDTSIDDDEQLTKEVLPIPDSARDIIPNTSSKRLKSKTL